MAALLLSALITRSIAVVPYTITPLGITGITVETTADNLAYLFGEENLENTREHLGEGFYAKGTLVNAGTENELAIVWEQGSISEIRIQGSGPRTAEGIGLGSTLVDLEEVIGEFEMTGFAWDYEGYVYLEGTVYEGLYIRITPENEVPEQLIGDRLFSSGELREFNLIVTDLRILF